MESANKNKRCLHCEILRKELLEKDNEIEKLKLDIVKLRNLLSGSNQLNKNYKDENKSSLDSLEISSVKNYLSVESLNNDCFVSNVDDSNMVESKSGQTNLNDHPITNNRTEEENHVEAHTKSPYGYDFVFDDNYQMYYSLSTGYYYDEKRGLMYEPHSCTYYKYNYDKEIYEVVMYTSENSEDKSSNTHDTILNKVHNFNLNDDDTVKSNDCKDKIFEEDVQLSVTESNKEKNLNIVNCNVSENFTELDASKDWLLVEGSKMSIAEMVKKVVDENTNMSDYIYDDLSKMHYSPSTGYYYNAESHLLYDPSSGIYYLYDAEEQTFRFYCQTTPNILDTKMFCKSENNSREENRKSRKKYWKKKLNLHTNQSTEIIKLDESNGKSPNEEYSSPEDGEIFSSSEDESNTHTYIEHLPVKEPCLISVNSLEDVSPSIRAIVECSDKLKIGSLILITCSGGIIGRDKTNAIYIPDICVSKMHAEVKYKSDLQQYSVEDLGSQNGTFINEMRLSETKERSEPHILNHGDKLSLGSCKLLLHIHTGYETCDNCEPGQVLADISLKKEKNVVMTKEEKENIRREELRRLKKKYGLQGVDFESTTKLNSSKEYEDKAEIRRQTVGSDNPYEKTEEASMDSSMSKKNKGYQMLTKMGWKEGQTLGTNGNSGIHDPIPIYAWPSRSGFGSNSSVVTDDNIEHKEMTWMKAQK